MPGREKGRCLSCEHHPDLRRPYRPGRCFASRSAREISPGSSVRTARARPPFSISSPASTNQTAGTVHLEERNITGFAPERLARLGMVRTFQNIELFGQMSVLENVMVGLHTQSHSGILSCAFKLPGQIREERAIRERAMQWLEFVGIADMARITGGEPPLRQRAASGNCPGHGPRAAHHPDGRAGGRSQQQGNQRNLPFSSGKSGNRGSPWYWWNTTWNW